MASIPLRMEANNGFRNSFSGKPPHVYLSAETDDVSEFDQVAIKQWQDEGFGVSYIPFNSDREVSYKKTLQDLGKDLSLGERFAVVGRHMTTISIKRVRVMSSESAKWRGKLPFHASDRCRPISEIER